MVPLVARARPRLARLIRRAPSHRRSMSTVTPLQRALSFSPSRTLERSATVAFPRQDVYSVVAGVEHYAEFLPWCTHVAVDEASRRVFNDSGDVSFEADLRFQHDKIPGPQTIRHKVMARPGEMVVSKAVSDSPLFTHLSYKWHFEDASPAGAADAASAAGAAGARGGRGGARADVVDGGRDRDDADREDREDRVAGSNSAGEHMRPGATAAAATATATTASAAAATIGAATATAAHRDSHGAPAAADRGSESRGSHSPPHDIANDSDAAQHVQHVQQLTTVRLRLEFDLRSAMHAIAFDVASDVVVERVFSAFIGRIQQQSTQQRIQQQRTQEGANKSTR